VPRRELLDLLIFEKHEEVKIGQVEVLPKDPVSKTPEMGLKLGRPPHSLS